MANLYFIGKYRDRAESSEPELMQKVQHNLSFDAADVLTTEYNERLGHTVKDGELLRRDWASPYFMFGRRGWELAMIGKNVLNSPATPPEDFDDSVPSLEAGDWHDGPHEYEDGYDDDGQGIVCVKCAKARREAKNER